jgi:hypothetical protein
VGSWVALLILGRCEHEVRHLAGDGLSHLDAQRDATSLESVTGRQPSPARLVRGETTPPFPFARRRPPGRVAPAAGDFAGNRTMLGGSGAQPRVRGSPLGETFPCDHAYDDHDPYYDLSQLQRRDPAKLDSLAAALIGLHVGYSSSRWAIVSARPRRLALRRFQNGCFQCRNRRRFAAIGLGTDGTGVLCTLGGSSTSSRSDTFSAALVAWRWR